ncbi:hypothetical protein BDV3_006217 [Batrachochytrium dendrobatidis]
MENYVQALQNVIQNMQNEIASLRAERSIPQVQATLNIPPPDRYNGDRSKFTTFVSQCNLVMRMHPTQFPSDQARVGFMISLLTDPAAEWATPLLAANDPVLNSLPEFINLFRRQFDDPDRERSAEAQLKNFEQGQRSCADYATEFLRLSADTDWNDGAKIFIFKGGLSSDIKTHLSYAPECPRDLRSFIDLCIRADERITELRNDCIDLHIVGRLRLECCE